MTKTLLPSPPLLKWDSSQIEIDDLMETIDTELMKRGTLSAESIDWQCVRSNAEKVLLQCPELSAVRAYILAEERGATTESFNNITGLLQRLFDHYWAEALPISPRRRKAWGSEMVALLERLTLGTVEQFGPLDSEQTENLVTLLKSFYSEGFDTAAVQSALSSAPKPDDAQDTEEVENKDIVQTKLDAASRAKLRRDIRALSDRIVAYDPEAPISFSLRAYAAWLEHQNPPPSDANGKIAQHPMPSGIVQQMYEHLKTPNQTGLLKIENRLYDSPDWFEGHKIAFEMAQELGYSAVSEIIRNRVAERLKSLPDLLSLSYANDTPLISDEIRMWVADDYCSMQEPQDVETQPTTLEESLFEIEQSSHRLGGSRAKALARLKLARVLLSNGFSGQARLLLDELSKLLAAPLPEDWEQDLRRDISLLITETEHAGR